MKIIIGVLVVAAILISIGIIDESFAEESRMKFRFWGNHHMQLFGEPQIDFKVTPLVEIPYIVNADIRVGDYKTHLYGGGYLKQTYGYYDRQCKSLTGHEFLFSEEGDYVRIDYYGKVCYLGSNIKNVNLIFKGSDARGIFEGAEIKGTLSGTSDRYESNYNLSINSVLVY